jgi:hypothetical protein
VLGRRSVAQLFAQSTATAPIVLPRGKKEMTPEAQARESKKRAARRVVAKKKEKDKKATEEKARQAEMMQAVLPRLWPNKQPSMPSPCSRVSW